jgi:hypothetical protein
VHIPQPWQTVSMTEALFWPRKTVISMAPKGQVEAHLAQPTQRWRFTAETWGSLASLSLEKRLRTLPAAALPWATEAGMSFGPWQAPAR